jgi:hypothetical protein
MNRFDSSWGVPVLRLPAPSTGYSLEIRKAQRSMEPRPRVLPLAPTRSPCGGGFVPEQRRGRLPIVPPALRWGTCPQEARWHPQASSPSRGMAEVPIASWLGAQEAGRAHAAGNTPPICRQPALPPS